MAETPPVLTELPWNYGHGAEGDMWYQGADGVWLPVERPGDYATQFYVLTYNPITGAPYPVAVTGLTPVEAFGYGTGYGLGYGRD
jgi:hypothetical protein